MVLFRGSSDPVPLGKVSVRTELAKQGRSQEASISLPLCRLKCYSIHTCTHTHTHTTIRESQLHTCHRMSCARHWGPSCWEVTLLMLRAIDFFVCLLLGFGFILGFFVFFLFFSEDGKETVESKLQMPYGFGNLCRPQAGLCFWHGHIPDTRT